MTHNSASVRQPKSDRRLPDESAEGATAVPPAATSFSRDIGEQADRFVGASVSLNVGGYRHRVDGDILAKIPYFQPLLRGGTPPVMEVDRDGAAFGEVIAFAAAGETFSGPPRTSPHVLRDEADFYSYDTLLEELTLLPFRLAARSTPSAHTSMSLALALSAVGSSAESEDSRAARAAEAMQVRQRAQDRLLRGLDVEPSFEDTSLRVQSWHLDHLEACWQVQRHANTSLDGGERRLGVARELGALAGGPPRTDTLLAVAGGLPVSSEVMLSIARVAKGIEDDAAAMLPTLGLAEQGHPATVAAQHALCNATAGSLMAAGFWWSANQMIQVSDSKQPTFDRAALMTRSLVRRSESRFCPAEAGARLDAAYPHFLHRALALAGQSRRNWAQVVELTQGAVLGGAARNEEICLDAATRAAGCPDATWRERLALVEMFTTRAGRLSHAIPPAARRAAGQLVEDGAPGTWLRVQLLLAAARLLQASGRVEGAADLAREAASTMRALPCLRSLSEKQVAHEVAEVATVECEILFQEGRFAAAEEAARHALLDTVGHNSTIWFFGFLSALRRGELDAVRSWLAPPLTPDPSLAARECLVYAGAALECAILGGRPDEVRAAAAQRARVDHDSSPLLELKVASYFAGMPGATAERQSTATAAWDAVDEQEEELDLLDALAMLGLARALQEPERVEQAMDLITDLLPTADPIGNGSDVIFMVLEEARRAVACGQPDQARTLCRTIRDSRWQHLYAQRSAATILRQVGDEVEADGIDRLIADRLEGAEDWGPALVRTANGNVSHGQVSAVAPAGDVGAATSLAPSRRGTKREHEGAGDVAGQDSAEERWVRRHAEILASSATAPESVP